MNKFLRNISLSLLAATLLMALSGCLSDTTPLTQRSQGLIDMGRMDIPGTAYKMHGFRLDNGESHDHFLYIVEDANGELLAGVKANEVVSAGKGSTTTDAVQTDVPSFNTRTHSSDAPSPADGLGLSLTVKLSCDSVEQCQRKLAAVQATQ